MDKEIKVKDCPFCKSKADAANYVIEGAIWCISCRATIVRKHTNKDYIGNGMALAIKDWNKRTTKPPTRK